MTTPFNKLPESYQGILYITAGAMALLYALGFIEKGITILIIGLALYAIVVGCTKLNLFPKLSALIKK